mmetsp:Transcript_17724/g.51037  ORF Transcript_17724/g.51037 Transcript_17724/m.51037 type:complete len:232 (-) Transcript_17724:1189-1884(-)
MLPTEIVPVVTESISGRASIPFTTADANSPDSFVFFSARAMSAGVALLDAVGWIFEVILTEPADNSTSTSLTDTPTAFAITSFIFATKLAIKSVAFTRSSYVMDSTVMLNSTVSSVSSDAAGAVLVGEDGVVAVGLPVAVTTPPAAWEKVTWSAEIAQAPRLSLPYLQSPTQSKLEGPVQVVHDESHGKHRPTDSSKKDPLLQVDGGVMLSALMHIFVESCKTVPSLAAPR